MSEQSRLLSNRVRVKSPLEVDASRYEFLGLEQAEPNLDAPDTAPDPNKVWVLSSDESGIRAWVQIKEGGQGIQGIQGPQGIQGIQGLQGIQGVGLQGIQGIQGIGNQGIQGIQGDFGLQGIAGQSVRIIGSLFLNSGTEQVQLNSTFVPPAVSGDGVIDENLGYLWVYNGSGTWINVGQVRGPQGVQGPRGFQGIQGPQGTRGTQGIQGDYGIQGNQGIQGTQGTTGSQGFQGIQGSTGLQGSQGIQGDQGVQGQQGIQGQTGTQGLQGIQGRFGLQGIQGQTGTQGAQGIQGDLGFQGIQGLSVQGVQGIQGNQGIQGVQGIGTQGIQGDQGIQGIQGQTGTQGAQGIQGDIGFQGVQGDQGVQGKEGTQGAQGIQGDIGFQGVQGIQGEIGTQGIQGNQGVQGVQGVIGEQGVQGQRGFQGNQGVQGTTGNQGVQGFTGSQGFRGFQGIQGVQGDQGIQGVQGIQGPQGVRGFQGIQGDQGVQGVQGTQGLQGIQGPQGPQGVQGLQGPQGLQGVQGQRGRDLIIIGSVADANAAYPAFDSFSAGSNNPQVYLTYTWGSTVSNPPSGGTLGTANFNEGIIDELTGDLYILQADLTTWVNVGSLKGTQGTQGIQGVQGPQGPQGVQGLQGPQGIQGFQGDKSGFSYVFNTSTTIGDPAGTGTLSYSSGTFASITAISIDALTAQGTDVSDIIATWDDAANTTERGIIVIQGMDNSSTVYGVFSLTSLTDNGTWLRLNVTPQGSGTIPSASQKIVVNFIRTGNQGIQGVQGPQGPQGTLGFQGVQGIQGPQGPQGTLGFQGVQGVQGPQGTTGIQGLQGPQGLQGIQGLQGFQGVNGKSLKIIGSVDDVNALYPNTTTGPNGPNDPQGLLNYYWGPSGGALGTSQENEGIIDEFTGDLWVLQANLTWINVGNIRGTQGIQGDQGVQGTRGQQGFQGLQGSTGNFGGATFDYTFLSNTLVTDPGIGRLKLNNSSYDLATILSIDDQDDNGTDIQNFLRTVDDSTSTIKGHFKIVRKDDASKFIFYAVNNLTEVNTPNSYFEISCTYLSGSLTPGQLSDLSDVLITFARTGDIGQQGFQGVQGLSNQGVQGPQGPQGVQGGTGTSIQGTSVQGSQGPQGPQGVQGPQGPQGTLGIQGFQGVQGTLGFQGVQGPQGTTGIQGFQGVQGTLGFQGVQGPQGTTGIQGFQGPQGTLGTQGNQGILGPIAGFSYQFSTTVTASDPGTGFFRFNSATLGSITEMYISTLDVNSVDRSVPLLQLDDTNGTDRARIFLPSGSAGFQVSLTLTGDIVNNGTYLTIPVTFTSGSLPANNELRNVIGVRTGVQGTIGVQGMQGIQGAFGLQGILGTQGITGPSASVPDQLLALNDISASFNGTIAGTGTTQFTISTGSPATNLINTEVDSSARLIISIGGVIQQPSTLGGTNGFYITGGTNRTTDPIRINFFEPPRTGQSFFGVVIKSTNSPTTPFATLEQSISSSIIFGV